MKKLLLIMFCISLTLPGLAFAQTPTSVNKQIDLLKDKVASKVAQLKLVEKRGVVGTVVKTATNSFTIEDINKKQVSITVDELTEYSSSEDSSFAFSDIKEGSEVWALGLYNKESEKILARFVNETAIPLFIHGVITSKDSEDFTLTLSSQDSKAYVIDIENVTRTLSYDKKDIVDTGFSKIPVMVNAIVVGFENPKEKNRITAGRIIIFPDNAIDPQITITKSEPTPTISK